MQAMIQPITATTADTDRYLYAKLTLTNFVLFIVLFFLCCYENCPIWREPTWLRAGSIDSLSVGSSPHYLSIYFLGACLNNYQHKIVLLVILFLKHILPKLTMRKNNRFLAGLCTSQAGHLFYPQMTRMTRIKIKKICVHP